MLFGSHKWPNSFSCQNAVTIVKQNTGSRRFLQLKPFLKISTMKNTLPLLFLFIATWGMAQPDIRFENVTVTRKAGNILSITYDLLYPTNDLAEVKLRATTKGGVLFDFNTSNATGQVGTGVSGGMGLNIEWDYSAYAGTTQDFRIMLVARQDKLIDIQSLVDQVDSTRLSGDLAFLEGVRHRTAGAAHLSEVQDFIKYQFLENGLETSVQTFANGSYTAQNIIGRLIGTEQEGEVYILDGHYDSVSNSPGADDNASAVAGVLEAVRILAPYGFKKTIRFIGFDLEEAGLVGSGQYVQNGILPQENINGVLNFEMIGYYSDEPNSQDTPVGFSLLFPEAYDKLEANEFRGDFINIVANGPAKPLWDAYENAITTYVPSLNFVGIQAPANWQVIANDLGRSDHAPFWIAGMPAIMLTDGANFRNPYYHTPEDTADKLNYTFMHNVVQATIATLAEVAGIEFAATWWTDTDFATPVKEAATCDFQVSHNPAKDFLRVEWNDCQLGDFSIELININGSVVKRVVRPQQLINGQQLIDVRGLEKGVYFLKMKNRYGQAAKKVVIG